MFESGLMTHWQRHWWGSQPAERCSHGDAQRVRVITLRDVYTAFLAAGVGAGLAVLTLGLEAFANVVGTCKLLSAL